MTLYQHYLEKNGEAVNWYISHFDNQDFNDYPLTFAAGDFPDFREQYDPTALSRSWNTSLNLPYPSGELADILAGILTEAGVEIRYETPACQLVEMCIRDRASVDEFVALRPASSRPYATMYAS